MKLGVSKISLAPGIQDPLHVTVSFPHRMDAPAYTLVYLGPPWQLLFDN